jgi:hypothetical protein
MNASDIIKNRQNRVLYQAYTRPTIFSTLITSTINYCPVSTISSGGSYISSFTSTINIQYGYTCEKPAISYELLNDINDGKYLCGYPYCSSISIWNTGQTIPVGDCDCKISFLTWKNTNLTPIYNYNSTLYSSVTVTSTNILTGPTPFICSNDFYQGTNFNNRCGNSGNC